MANFQNIKDLIRTLSQGQKLLFDMFRKRRTVPVKYDDAVETLDGNENILLRMIKFGVIVQSGNNLELEDSYQEFFEKFLPSMKKSISHLLKNTSNHSNVTYSITVLRILYCNLSIYGKFATYSEV